CGGKTRPSGTHRCARACRTGRAALYRACVRTHGRLLQTVRGRDLVSLARGDRGVHAQAERVRAAVPNTSAVFRSGIGFAVAIVFTLAAPAVAQTPAEKLYAELARLPAAERTARLEAGARAEGKLAFVHTLRAKLGLDHINLFRKRYPFIDVDASDM